MDLPVPTSSTGGLILAAVFGLIFGILLQKGRVADYEVIVNFFRLREMTVLKVMLTAIGVGGIGKVRLTDVTGIPEFAWWALLVVGAAAWFTWLRRSGELASEGGR
jgi:hypothetical protein